MRVTVRYTREIVKITARYTWHNLDDGTSGEAQVALRCPRKLLGVAQALAYGCVVHGIAPPVGCLEIEVLSTEGLPEVNDNGEIDDELPVEIREGMVMMTEEKP